MTRVYHKKGTKGTIPIDLSDTDEPPWLKEINPHSSLNTRDLVSMFKVSRTCLETMIKDGRIPQADHTIRVLKGGVHVSIRQWYAKTIRQFFKRQERNKHQ